MEEIKAIRGSLSSMRKHLRNHEEQGFLSNKQELKKWLVASLRCTRNIPANVFNCPEIKLLFSMANLATINSDIVRRFSDEEAK